MCLLEAQVYKLYGSWGFATESKFPMERASRVVREGWLVSPHGEDEAGCGALSILKIYTKKSEYILYKKGISIGNALPPAMVWFLSVTSVCMDGGSAAPWRESKSSWGECCCGG